MRPASAIIYQYLCVSPEYLLLQQSLVKALFGLKLQMMRNAKERACCASSLNTPISYEYIRQSQGGSNISVFAKFETLRSLKYILFLSFKSHVYIFPLSSCYFHVVDPSHPGLHHQTHVYAHISGRKASRQHKHCHLGW